MEQKKFQCEKCKAWFKFDYSTTLGMDLSVLSESQSDEKIKDYLQNVNFSLDKVKYCMECLKSIIKEMEIDNSIITGDTSISNYDYYKDKFVEKHSFEPFFSSYLMTQLRNEMQKYGELNSEEILKEESELKEKLAKLTEEANKSEEAVDNLVKQLDLVNQDEHKFWTDFNNFEKNILLLEKEKNVVQNRNSLIEKQIKSLSTSNIFGDLFQISFSDKVGIINYCKMNSPSSQSYDEINAGWGYIAFLTKILACKFNFDSKKYRISDIGNYTKIEEISTKTTYYLSLSDNSRTLEEFNKGMRAFLAYFQEFVDYLKREKIISEQKMNGFKFEIINDRINGKGIAYDSNKAEEWTQCIKYLLTFLKFLITQVLQQEDKAFSAIIEKTKIFNPPVQQSK